ncbi:MAG: allantoinase AllB [Pirellulaceae bacterium]|nr:allantoinase AllB [Pirellulaceae bacterium]
MKQRFAIASRQVVTPACIGPAAIVIADGKIEQVTTMARAVSLTEVLDYGDAVIGPGLIDSHIHINEPGRSEWEGFVTATQAAAAGGITTLIDMPLNSSPVTTSADALLQKVAAAQHQCWVDVGFYGGLVPTNLQHIPELIDAGVFGIKAFLCDSGLEEFPAVTRRELDFAMRLLAQANVPLLVHAELADDLPPPMTRPDSYVEYVHSRPSRWEINAIGMLLELARLHGCQVHIVHLATADAAIWQELAEARRNGVAVTVETCPHYLYFAMEEIADRQPIYKCAPPIRSADNRAGLRRALLLGLIDTIGSDHSPCPAELKCIETGNVQLAWGGIAGVQFMLPAVWQALQADGVELPQLFQWMSTRPAQLLKLSHRKGSIQPGLDADLVVWDSTPIWSVQPNEVLHRNGISPYVFKLLRGKTLKTFVRGQLVYDGGTLSSAPQGDIIRR